MGCTPGVRWKFGSFEDVHPRAQKENRLCLVYFRSWYLVDCTDFEEHVLKDPLVLLETLSMVCVPLDFDYDRPLASRWGLKAVPAYAIVAPNHEVLARSETPITRDQLLEEIRNAKNKYYGGREPPIPFLNLP